jgi:hypothetical protein
MTITITKDSGNRIEVLGELEFAVHATVEAIEDVADAIEAEASAQAPLGKTGELKAHPVDRDVAAEEYLWKARGISSIQEKVLKQERFHLLALDNLLDLLLEEKAEDSLEQHHLNTPLWEQDFLKKELLEKIVMTIPEEPEHARWVHDGTGIYGPNNHPIIPNSGKIMVWENEDGNTIKAKSVKGQKANPYLERAFVIIERTFYPARVEALRAEIRAI